MPKMQTPADLDRRREEVAPQLLIRLEAPTTIRVGMGACGIAAGVRESMHAILAEWPSGNSPPTSPSWTASALAPKSRLCRSSRPVSLS